MTLRVCASTLRTVRVKISLFCVVGIAVGVLSLTAIWLSTFKSAPATIIDGSVVGLEYYNTGIDIAEGDYPSFWIEELIDTDLMRFGAFIVILGLLIGLITPLGGVGVVTGAVVFIQAVPDYIQSMDYRAMFLERGIGPFIAILSGSIMMLSCLFPAWFGHASDRPRLADRFLTMRFWRTSGERPDGRVQLHLEKRP